MSNQIQISNEMPKQVRHDNNFILNSFQNPFFELNLRLAFACLPAPVPTEDGVGRDFDI
jgi:hypothetical protein